MKAKKIWSEMIITLVLVINLCPCVIKADTVRQTGAKEYKAMYAIPEGGWSTITYQMNLRETFSNNSTTKKNVFSRHEKIAVWKMEYATERPSLVIGNIMHKDSSGNIITTFSSYKKQDLIYSAQWDGGEDLYNTTQKSYSTSTKNYAFLPFYTSCSGALFSGGTDSSAFHSIQLNLR